MYSAGVGLSLSDFFSHCEKIWKEWLSGNLERTEFLSATFCLCAAPEPYLKFGDCETKPLIFLTTNPGAPILEVQERAAVLTGKGLLKSSMTYGAASVELGKYYAKKLPKGAAKYRICAMRDLAEVAGYSGVIQIEVCPLHSASLGAKDKLLGELRRVQWFKDYESSLKEYLRDKPVVVLSACGRNEDLTSVELSSSSKEWRAWIAGLAGFDVRVGRLSGNPLTTKGDKWTSAVYISSRSLRKAMVLMMGGNHLPNQTNRKCLTLFLSEGDPKGSAIRKS